MNFADMAAEAMNDPDGDDTDRSNNVTPIRQVTDSEAAQMHNGQTRMAYRLAVLYRDKLLHVHNTGWHYWDGKRWAEDDKGATKRAVLATFRQALRESVGLDETARDILRKDVRKCESGAGVIGVLGIAMALEVFAATVKDLDADPYLLNCANGTLDLRTMQLRAHDPADRITKVTTAAFDPEAHGPTWDKFIQRVLPNEDVRGFLQRYTGTSLCGRVLEHKLAILTGEGRNGKGVFYGAAIAALGDYAQAAEPELLMHRDGARPTGVMDLRDSRFVVVSENDKDRKLAEATVKRLTGGDRIKARKMREDFVEFDPSHTPVLVTNHLPKVSGDDPSLWARLRVVPFEVVIPEAEQDTHLAEKLELETDAILAWIIQGWTDYDRAGLQEPDEVTEATWNYRQDSDAYARFVSEQCYKAPPLQVKASKVWERWQRWSKTEGVDESSQKVLGQALERMGFEPARTKTGRFWKGLDLVEEEPEEPPYGSSQGWRRQKVTRMTRVPVTSIEPFLWRYTDVTSLASPVTKTPSVDRYWTERLDRSVAEMTERVLRELSDYEKQLQNPDLTPVERRRYERWRRQLLHETGMGDWTTWGTTASGPEVEQCSEVGPTPNGDYSAKKSNPDTNHHQTTPGSSAPEAGT